MLASAHFMKILTCSFQMDNLVNVIKTLMNIEIIFEGKKRNITHTHTHRVITTKTPRITKDG